MTPFHSSTQWRITPTGKPWPNGFKLERYTVNFNQWVWMEVKPSDLNPDCGDYWDDPETIIDEVRMNITDNAEYLMV